MTKGQAFRAPTAVQKTGPASWDECVRLLMGPRLVGEPEEQRQRQALELAAAALRFAGQPTLAASLLVS